jgi:hypothetical protein
MHREVGRAKDLSSLEDKPNEVIWVTSYIHSLAMMCAVAYRGDFEHCCKFNNITLFKYLLVSALRHKPEGGGFDSRWV